MENNKTKIKVVDSIMGQGKTTWAMEFMKERPDERFIFVTPFLDEVERIKANVPNIKTPFVDFKKNEPKLETFRDLLLKGNNIATTHSLMSKFDLDIQENIKVGEYTLILDEVTQIAETYTFNTKTDKTTFFRDFAYVDEDGYVVWDEDKHPSKDYEKKSVFYDEMVLCLNRHLIVINNKLMMWELPVELFNSFKEVYILTYLFEGSIQKPYFDLFDVEYEYLSIENGKLIPYKATPKELKQEIMDLINLVDNPKLNSIGDNYYALSASWFENNIKKNSVYSDSLRKSTTNFFKNICKGNATENLISTFSEYYNTIKDKGWSNKNTSFLVFNKKATNDYIHKKNLAYLINIFPHSGFTMYFNNRMNGKVSINEDMYALSIMIQWIWRSRIRNQELSFEDRKINLYLPSKRMREILLNWLNQ